MSAHELTVSSQHLPLPSCRIESRADASVIHPLGLLSVDDHAARVPLSNKKRVLGVLLGQDDGNTINVANSCVAPLGGALG